jgi:hypothetical protein
MDGAWRRRRCPQMTMAGLFTIDPGGGSYTLRFLGGGLAGFGAAAVVALGLRRRRLAMVGGALALAVVVIWFALYAARPRWLRAALADPRGVPDTGVLRWERRAPGLETAELPVFLHGVAVDSVALVRLDPAHYALSVHWDGSNPRTAEVWQRDLGAAVVVNGSYFEPDFEPATPIRVDGEAFGPPRYRSSHGALVIDDTAAAIVDLRGREVDLALAPARDAMVSYPLLVDGAGQTRAAGHDDWFANRVFIGLDAEDHLVLGTTRTGFFSLPRLGAWLVGSPLGLRIALNLDGGPLASQVVAVPGWRRVVHGNAEISDAGDVLRLAYQRVQAARGNVERLPIVLAAHPR